MELNENEMTLTLARGFVDTGLEDTGLQLLIDAVNADRSIPACAGESQQNGRPDISLLLSLGILL